MTYGRIEVVDRGGVTHGVVHPAVKAVADTGDGVAVSVGVTTSTTVIWFIVSVPVLSELMAEVSPSVSTDGRSFTIALRLARSIPPRDKIV